MIYKALFLTALATLAFGFPAQDESGVKHYNGYKVVRAMPETQGQYEAIAKLAYKEIYDFWQEPRPGGVADIMTSPAEYVEVVSYLKAHGIKYRDMISDLEGLIQAERISMASRHSKRMDWANYHSWEEINEWLAELVAANNSIITSEQYGVSYEGRPLHVYKVSTGGSGKPVFWIDATIHAREWITTKVITYIINELVNSPSNYTELLDNMDFYFAPFINPDGFSYSRDTDRMWRRTRSNQTVQCKGVDCNRNYGFQFGGPGSSPTPCSETYRGPEAYSEPESKSMVDYINAKRAEGVNLEAFITLHSYSQLWMTPYGYTETPPSDYADLKQVGDAAAAALYAHYNTAYEVGNAGAILYLSSGSSRDWAKGEGGFKWVYTIELRDTGDYGFLLPPDQILPTSIETWSGIQVVARQLIR